MPSSIETAAGPARMDPSVRDRLAGIVSRENAVAAMLLGAAIALGAFLRVQQIDIQWLIDDEWHAINRIQSTDGYAALLASFGHADYSIPLALLDRLLAQTIGLTELAMRLPMLVCGIATLVIGGMWVWRRLGPPTAVLFTFYLAVSSLLICYSRNARPYAITLLLAGVAIVMLAKWRSRRSLRAGAAYAASTWLAAWLHLTAAPLLIAPLIWVFAADVADGWRKRDWRAAVQSFALGAALAAALAAAIVPPLLLDPHALAGKLGQHAVALDTLVGAFHIMAGSASPIVVVALLALAAVGLPTLCRKLPAEMTLFAVGLATTVVLLLVMQPMWINHALVLVRYLLPLLPVLLLAAACGTMRIAAAIDTAWLRAAVVGAAAFGMLAGSPHADLLQRPNNFTLHSYHQFDYRKAGNETRHFIDQIPTSPYWSTLTRFTPGTLRIAVAGHGFESFHVGDARWQPLHRQRLFNAQLSGFCMPLLPGEGLREHGVRLANVVTLAERESLERRRIDILVWKKLDAHSAPMYADIAPCEPRLREAFGTPSYEDEHLMAFVLRERAS